MRYFCGVLNWVCPSGNSKTVGTHPNYHLARGEMGTAPTALAKAQEVISE
jgi:hypothetical protein